jgi:formylglycine-generating enzyme required for sulfatase activity
LVYIPPSYLGGDVCLMATETRVAWYRPFVQLGPGRKPPTSGDHTYGMGNGGLPVTGVIHKKAARFCDWAAAPGWQGQLPPLKLRKELGRPYPWGPSPPPDCRRVVMSSGGSWCGNGSPLPVATRTKGSTRSPLPGGIFDLVGNVAEWLPHSACSGTGQNRSCPIAGGSGLTGSPSRLRPGWSFTLGSDANDPSIGFRCQFKPTKP